MTDPCKSRLDHHLDKIAREREIDRDVLRAVLCDFLAALHENSVKGWRQEDALVGQVYWALGDQATYHLFGFLAEVCPGDHVNDLWTEIAYLDPRLKRFNKISELWEQEREWEIEDGK